MQFFTFFEIDPADRVRSFDLVDCADTADAKARACALLEQRPECAAVEIWDDQGMTGRVDRMALASVIRLRSELS